MRVTALAEVAQGDHGHKSGHGPGQLALDGPAWAGGLDQKTFRGLFETQPFLVSVVQGTQI